MTDTILINCDAVLGPFRQWQAEQESIDSQLSESLSALSAYQSHLDEWQQQLAREREQLRAEREQWDRECSEIVQTSDSEALSAAAIELNAARDEIASLTAALNSRSEELRVVQEQLEQDRSAADINQARLTEVTEDLNAARGEIATLTRDLITSAEELRAERQKIELNESSADHHQAKLAEATTELNAARDKISALTTMLLSRTEELRTLDVRRAEASVELEMARIRERELLAELEELKQERECELEQWADESRLPREMVECGLEDNDREPTTDVGGSSQQGEPSEPKNVERPAESPVFASVKEQFGKLRQQRAMDRPATKKAR